MKQVEHEMFGREIATFDENEGRVVAGNWYDEMRLQDTVSENGVIVGYSSDPLDGIRPVRVPMNAMYDNVGVFGGNKDNSIISIVSQQLADVDDNMCYIGSRNDSIRFVRSLPENRLDDVVWISPENHHFNFLDPFLEKGHEEEQFDKGSIHKTIKNMISHNSHFGVKMESILSHIVDHAYHEACSGESIEFDYLLDTLNGDGILDDSYSLSRAEQTKEPLRRRFSDLASRDIMDVCNDPDGLSLYDTISEGSIIVCPTTTKFSDTIDNRNMETLITALLWTLWRAMRIDYGESDNPNDFMLVVNDDDVFTHSFDAVENWLEEEFHENVGCIVNAPSPMEFETDVRMSLFSQCHTKFAFNVCDTLTANTLAGELGGVERNKLMRLDDNEWVALIVNRYNYPVEMEGTVFQKPKIDSDLNVFNQS